MTKIQYYTKGQHIWTYSKPDMTKSEIDRIRAMCDPYGDIRIIYEEIDYTCNKLHELAQKGREL